MGDLAENHSFAHGTVEVTTKNAEISTQQFSQIISVKSLILRFHCGVKAVANISSRRENYTTTEYSDSWFSAYTTKKKT